MAGVSAGAFIPGVSGVPDGGVINLESLGVSTSNTGAANFTIFQSALTRGGVVQLTRPGVYFLSNQLIIGSNTQLTLGQGVTIRQSSGNNRTMLVTEAYLATASSVSLAWASGPTLTVTWTAHGLTEDDYVVLLGANEMLFNQVFKVQTITNANTFTVLLPETPAAGPTGTFTAKKCTRNFIIEGGTWDYDYANNGGGTELNRMTMIIGYAGDFYVSDIDYVRGYKYSINVGAAMDYTVERCSQTAFVVGSSCELLKTYGPARSFTYRDLNIRHTDDGMSIQPTEGPAFLGYRWTRGHIYDGVVERVRGQGEANGSGMICLYGDPDGNCYARDIKVRDVWGDQIGSIVCLSGGTSAVRWGNIEIDGVSGNMRGTSAPVLLGLSNFWADVVTVRNVTAYSPANGQIHAFSIFDARELIVERGRLNSAAGVPHLLVNNSTIDQIIVQELYARQSSGSLAFLISVVSTSGTVRRLTVQNNTIRASSNTGLLTVGGTFDQIVTRCNMQMTSGDRLISANGPVDFNLAIVDNVTDALSIVNSSSSAGIVNLTVGLGGNRFTANSNGVIRITQTTNAYTIAIRSAGTNQIANAAHVTVVSGTPSITIYGWDIAVDPLTLAGLQTTAGQFLTSSQVAPDSGPTVRSAVGWVALGTGAAGVNTIIT